MKSKYFFKGIMKKKKWLKDVIQQIVGFDYVDQMLLVLSVLNGVISSFATAIGTSVKLLMSFGNEFVKLFFKAMTKRERKHKTIVLLGKSKLKIIKKHNIWSTSRC